MQQQRRILLVLPRGEAIKNFIYSGVTRELRKNAHVIVISVVPNQRLKVIIEENCDEFYELIERKQPTILAYYRDWMDVVHGRYIWSKAAEFRWRVRDIESNTLAKKIKRFFKKNLALPFANLKGVYFLSEIEEFLSEQVYSDDYYTKLLKAIKPDLVFNASHIHSNNTLPILHSAKHLKIKTSTFLFSWDNLTSQGRIMPEYDNYLVWNGLVLGDLMKIYPKISPKQVYVSGTPQFDFHFNKSSDILSRAEYCKLIGADPLKPIVLYTTGMINAHRGEEVVVERIADIVEEMPEKPQLVVRVYPKDMTGRFNEVKSRRKDIVFPEIPWVPKYFTPLPEDLDLWINMLYHCEVGINIASTVSLELCMFNKPTINVAYNPPGLNIYPHDYPSYYDWDHYKPLTDSGAISVAWSEEEIRGLITEAIEHPEWKSEMRQKLIKNFFGDLLDGRSYERVADALLEISNK